MRRILLSCILAFLLCTSSFSTHAWASSINTSYKLQGPTSAARGSHIRIVVSVESTTQAINAVQGTIQFPQRMIAIDAIQLDNSIIAYWQQQPTSDNNSGHISFTGGLPTPGYKGTNGTLFTILAHPIAIGTIRLVSNTSSIILANDHRGTILPTTQGMVEIISVEPGHPKPTPTPLNERDIEPPTHLQLVAGRDHHLFDNEWFAAFQAEDSGSGIDHYEIAEVDPNTTYPEENEWERAQSPHILKNQSRIERIFFKAVDKAGNEAVTSILFYPCTPLPWWILALICLAIMGCLWIARKRNGRYARVLNSKDVQKI